ncbi:MAG: LLM class flavin-dependent oxidoreductase [Candidatus Nitrosopolaris sp.]
MKIGSQTGKNRATRENIIRLVQEAEDSGFDSLWVLERLIWPVNPQNQYPETKDGKFPEDWQYIFDPLETPTFVAAITDKIALRTSMLWLVESIIDILFHNPVILARRFATLDVLSKGRSIAGFGITHAISKVSKVYNIVRSGVSERNLPITYIELFNPAEYGPCMSNKDFRDSGCKYRTFPKDYKAIRGRERKKYSLIMMLRIVIKKNIPNGCILRI